MKDKHPVQKSSRGITKLSKNIDYTYNKRFGNSDIFEQSISFQNTN